MTNSFAADLAGWLRYLSSSTIVAGGSVMSLRVSASKRKAREIVADAEDAAAKMPPDPLLRSVPRTSAFVSAIDSVKKRHGLLIEEALIDVINRIPNWSATKEKVPIAPNQAHLDCSAHNSGTQQLYVFECKRGHGKHDRSAERAIDDRLDRVAAVVGSHAVRKGWAVKDAKVFILSFYGQKWESKYPVYNMDGIAMVFHPCLSTFTREFARHTELEVGGNYGREFAAGTATTTSDVRTVFDEIDEDEHPDGFVVRPAGHGQRRWRLP
jgi:hypothetical protein